AYRGIGRRRKRLVRADRFRGLGLSELEQFDSGEDFRIGFWLARRIWVIKEAVRRRNRKRVVGDEKQQFAVGNERGLRRTQLLAGFGDRAADVGGNAVGGLLQEVLGALGFDELLLFEEFGSEPAKSGDRYESEQEEEEEKGSGRFKPL